jgi:hypothetical protein
MELLPCPFCGIDKRNPPMILSNKKEKDMPIHTTIQCTNCGTEPNHYVANEDDAIKIWNTHHSPWISVENKLPKPYTSVLSYFDYELVIVYVDDKGCWFKDGEDCGFIYITHWMTLPTPPKEI